MNIEQLAVNIIFICKNLRKILTLSTEKEIAKILLRNAIKIATAESCTGGLVSSRLTDVSGSSAYVFQNFVTYANEAKVKLLGVNRETIQRNGVVSSEVALEMAEGLIERYDCTLAVSTTGIAGPLGATETKPVGLVYIGIANKNKEQAYGYEANPLLYRPVMKYAFMLKTFELLLEFLKENY